MSLNNIFGIAGTAMNSQLVRLNLTSSNLANAGTNASSPDTAFKAKRPVFQAILDQAQANPGFNAVGGVKIKSIMTDQTTNPKQYEPSNPNADKDGYLFKSNVNEVSEMVELMSASRSYQNNVEVVNTARELMSRTVDMLKT
jgi:flagellar basal-body rod protein FlgC